MREIKTIGSILGIMILVYLNREIWIYFGIDFPSEIPMVEQYIGTSILLGLVGIGLFLFVLLYISIRDNIGSKK